jgi:hypothetical protein
MAARRRSAGGSWLNPAAVPARAARRRRSKRRGSYRRYAVCEARRRASTLGEGRPQARASGSSGVAGHIELPRHEGRSAGYYEAWRGLARPSDPCIPLARLRAPYAPTEIVPRRSSLLLPRNPPRPRGQHDHAVEPRMAVDQIVPSLCDRPFGANEQRHPAAVASPEADENLGQPFEIAIGQIRYRHENPARLSRLRMSPCPMLGTSGFS